MWNYCQLSVLIEGCWIKIKHLYLALTSFSLLNLLINKLINIAMINKYCGKYYRMDAQPKLYTNRKHDSFWSMNTLTRIPAYWKHFHRKVWVAICQFVCAIFFWHCHVLTYHKMTYLILILSKLNNSPMTEEEINSVCYFSKVWNV